MKPKYLLNRESQRKRKFSFFLPHISFQNCTIANLKIQFLSLVVTSDRATSLDKMEGDHPDTVPGFMMQSQNFVLKFITGLQKGVVSKLLEMETDWLVFMLMLTLKLLMLMLMLMFRFDMMEIILSRLEDEPTNQER